MPRCPLPETSSPVPKSAAPLRVALFTETFLPRIDGTVTRLCHTIRHLRSMGHEVLVIAPRGEVCDFEGARVHGVPGVPFPLYPELKLSAPRFSIGKALAEFQPDVIHAMQPAVLGAAAFYYSSNRRVPLVVSYHAQLAKWLHYYGLGRLEPLLWWGIQSAYNRADLVLVTSRIMQRLLEHQGIERVKLWQRGVDTEAFHPREASSEMRVRLTQGHANEKLLLYVGRLSAEKEIERCRDVLEALPGVRLALVGDGPHRRKLEKHFAGTPTCFVGYLKGKELAAAFASADTLFLPSRTETLGLVLLEAMAAGCPVVAAAEGGVLDVVQDGVTGHLYAPARIPGAITAIRRLLEDSPHREAIRQRARHEVDIWGWAAATRQLVSLYRHVMEREKKLPQQIVKYCAQDASAKDICENLHISRATLKRLMRAGAGPQTPLRSA